MALSLTLSACSWPLWSHSVCTHAGRYATTIHTINSAIIKLSKLTYATAVYRGMAGAVLPPSCFEKNEDGIAGGIEYGFSSTTVDRGIALFYSKAKDAKIVSTIIEASQGMIDRGADISWLSQVLSVYAVMVSAAARPPLCVCPCVQVYVVRAMGEECTC